MIIIHAVQKLLNTSHIKTGQYVTQPGDGQLMHSWYARLCPRTFNGKLLTLYVHEPSLLTVVCRGKTIKGTWPEFTQRLPELLKRHHFPASFIEAETNALNGYVVAKTNSRSMLGFMNQMIELIQFDCSRFGSYEAIETDVPEDRMMHYFYLSKVKGEAYTNAKQYWDKLFSTLE
jgi:hypothetical protein